MPNRNLTFSGTDTIVFALFPNSVPIALGSLTTLSYSSYRTKRPVPVLGEILTKGVAKGGRVIAGTMVFTLINQHWVNELVETLPWLKEKTEGVVYSDELPLFDIVAISANEYGKYISMQIYGVSFTDEAGVLSINDMYSENTFSFIAREIRTFGKRELTNKELKYKSNKFFSNYDFTIDITNNEEYSNVTNNPIKVTDFMQEELNKIASDMFITAEALQNLLISLGYEDFGVTGNIDVPTYNAVNDIRNRFGYGAMEMADFLNNILLELGGEEYITEERARSNNEEGIIGTKTSSNMEDNFGYVTTEDITVLADKTVFIDGEEKKVYKTNYGWIYEEDLKNNSGGNNINSITYKGEDINKYKSGSVYYIEESTEEFLNEFNIEVGQTRNLKFEEYITNIAVVGGEKVTNSIKKEIVNGHRRIYYKDRIGFVKEQKANKFKIILKNINKNESVFLDIVCKAGA